MSTFDSQRQSDQAAAAPTTEGAAFEDPQHDAARGQAAEVAATDISGIARLVLSRMLRVGSQGEDVGWLQRGLNFLGDALTPDGIFGPLTQGAVHRFQDKAGLERDGVVGPQTWSHLVADTTGAAPPAHDPKEMDPRLDRNDKEILTHDGRKILVDQDNTNNRDQQKLPWMKGGEWDHAHILSLWSQVDTDDATITDAVRCAANAALAPRIIQGPESVIAFATEVLAKAEQLAQKPTTPDVYRDRLYSLRMPVVMAMASLRSSHFYHKFVEPVGPIPPDPFLGIGGDPLFADPASYSDLNIIADATKRLVSANDTGFSSPDEAAAMHFVDTAEAGHRAIGETIESRAEMDAFVDALLPGESYMILVDTSRGDPDPSHPHANEESDHFITVGREPDEKGGLRYLYDPYPRTGSQIIYLDAEDRETRFWPYFEVDPAAAGRTDVFKRTRIISAATAR
ncbi:MAG: peptidoglycan-binding protein [Myxococcales bacterium]|nr:peptidoglycan-binding protein [Myxococcales bacterium]